MSLKTWFLWVHVSPEKHQHDHQTNCYPIPETKPRPNLKNHRTKKSLPNQVFMNFGVLFMLVLGLCKTWKSSRPSTKNRPLELLMKSIPTPMMVVFHQSRPLNLKGLWGFPRVNLFPKDHWTLKSLVILRTKTPLRHTASFTFRSLGLEKKSPRKNSGRGAAIFFQ